MPTRPPTRSRPPAPVSESLGRLGERLRKARLEAGLSQAQLGAPHFTRAYVSALELGKIRPAMKSMEFLAARLGKPVSFFVDDEEKEGQRRKRELALVRASQLIAQGAAREAIAEISAIEMEGTSTAERLEVKRTLGRALLEADQPGKAAAVLGEAVRGFEALGHEEQAARTRMQLGVALIHLMDYAEAEVHLQSALTCSASGVVRDPLFRVHVLHNLGVSLYQRGNYSAALEHLERAAYEGADVADQKWLASLFAATGMARRQVGDYEGAISSLLKSEALFDALHNEMRVAEIKFQTARTLRQLGHRTRAAQVLDQAVAAAKAVGSDALAIRIEAFAAWTEAEDGSPVVASNKLEQLMSRADRAAVPTVRFAVRLALARTLTRLDPDRAVLILRELAAGLEAGSATSDLGDVYDALSKALARQGHSDEALAYAQRAFAASSRAKGGV